MEEEEEHYHTQPLTQEDGVIMEEDPASSQEQEDAATGHLSVGAVPLLCQVLVGSRTFDLAPTLCVLRVQRYVPDAAFEKKIGHSLRQEIREQLAKEGLAEEEEGEGEAAYDVTVSDGKHHCKCLLHPSLNHLVSGGLLLPGAVLKLLSWLVWLDESVIGGGDGVVILRSLRLLSHRTPPSFLSSLLKKSRRSPNATAPQQDSDVPLVGERGYYIHPYNETCVTGAKWVQEEELCPAAIRAESSIMLEEEAEEEEDEEGRVRQGSSMTITDAALERLLYGFEATERRKDTSRHKDKEKEEHGEEEERDKADERGEEASSDEHENKEEDQEEDAVQQTEDMPMLDYYAALLLGSEATNGALKIDKRINKKTEYKKQKEQTTGNGKQAIDKRRRERTKQQRKEERTATKKQRTNEHPEREEEEDGEKDGAEEETGLSLTTLAELLEEESTRLRGSRRNRDRGALVVRVKRKYKLHHYAKRGDNVKYPFNATVVVCDDKAEAKMVLWTKMCARYYSRLHVGDLLLVSRYRIKAEYPLVQGPPFEISLNYSDHPSIYKLDESQHPQAIPFIPVIQMNIRNFEQVMGLASPTVNEDEFFDYVGVIVFVGRQERTRRQPDANSAQRTTFSHYRWIELWDLSHCAQQQITTPTTNNKKRTGLKVKVFTTSQSFDVFANLQEGSVVLLSNLKTFAVDTNKEPEEDEEENEEYQSDNNAKTMKKRVLCCRTTLSTLIYNFGKDKDEYGEEEEDDIPQRWHPSTRAHIRRTMIWRRRIMREFYDSSSRASSSSSTSTLCAPPLRSVFLRTSPLSYFQQIFPEVPILPLQRALPAISLTAPSTSFFHSTSSSAASSSTSLSASFASSRLEAMERRTLIVQGFVLSVGIPLPLPKSIAPITTASTSTKLQQKEERKTEKNKEKEKEEEEEVERTRSRLQQRRNPHVGAENFQVHFRPELEIIDASTPHVLASVTIKDLNHRYQVSDVPLLVPFVFSSSASSFSSSAPSSQQSQELKTNEENGKISGRGRGRGRGRPPKRGRGGALGSSSLDKPKRGGGRPPKRGGASVSSSSPPTAKRVEEEEGEEKGEGADEGTIVERQTDELFLGIMQTFAFPEEKMRSILDIKRQWQEHYKVMLQRQTRKDREEEEEEEEEDDEAEAEEERGHMLFMRMKQEFEEQLEHRKFVFLLESYRKFPNDSSSSENESDDEEENLPSSSSSASSSLRSNGDDEESEEDGERGNSVKELITTSKKWTEHLITCVWCLPPSPRQQQH
ncbi:hypothetical protein QOT17_012393 [Balamuthia mandrillaris]